MNTSVQVDIGEILVADICLVAHGRNFAVYEADCHSKYAEIGWYGGSEDAGPTVGLIPGEYTKKADRSAPQTGTVITLPRKYRGWDTEATATRYTVRIVVWRRSRIRRRGKLAWRESDAQYEHARAVMDQEAEGR